MYWIEGLADDLWGACIDFSLQFANSHCISSSSSLVYAGCGSPIGSWCRGGNDKLRHNYSLVLYTVCMQSHYAMPIHATNIQYPISNPSNPSFIQNSNRDIR